MLTSGRRKMYTKAGDDRFVFQNPAFTGKAKPSVGGAGGQMRLKDFLASMPSFADFTDKQLLTLEQKAEIKKFRTGHIIFKQGEVGEHFYVIHKGGVEICIQPINSKLKKGDIGEVCNSLTEGNYFGERALMTTENRAASIRVTQETTCLVWSKAEYEEIISGSSALIGKDINDNVDWSKDHETRSLFRHVEKVLEIGTMPTSTKIRRILYELTTAFTPELSADEVVARMVMTVKVALKADRVGLFVLNDDKKTMVLKVSERSKGIRMPVRGLAGAVLKANKPMNIPDAYNDERFDGTMDRRTGYRTRQVMGVPVRHPLTGMPVGLLQVNNKADGSSDPFNAEQLSVLELAATQLSELLHGRSEVFVNSGNTSHEVPQGVNNGLWDGTSLVNSADVSTPFQIELLNLTLSTQSSELLAFERIPIVEVVVSLHLALGQICPQQVFTLVLPEGGRRKKAQALAAAMTTLHCASRLVFGIDVRDVPRAARVLFRVNGLRKQRSGSIVSSEKSSKKKKEVSNAAKEEILVGWAATPVYDFKGGLDSMVDVRLFAPPSASDIAAEDGPVSQTGNTAKDNTQDVNAMAMKTTLNNEMDTTATSLSAVLMADLVLNMEDDDEEDVTQKPQRVRVIHTMPASGAIDSEMSGANKALDPKAQEMMQEVLMVSFNPLCASLLTDQMKDFLWERRYSILDRADMLPAFVMCIRWNDAERVQELYDLLDLWDPPRPEQAMQLLDRRFNDPKIRAYAVHCLEELKDEELSLYMLQLCQQLKFESHVDSALSRFLLRRALTNLRLIGHIFFWLLQSEVYNVDVRKRFIALLQIYLRKCEHHRVELGHQMFVMKRLEHVAANVQAGESKSQRLEILHEQLRAVVLPTEFQLPLNPHITVKGIKVEKCRVMESKKKPLWMVLINADDSAPDIVLMLKVGDDLRQDALILQLLKVMDGIWRKEGLDMQMRLYGCISTGFERGLLQVVLSSTTLAGIVKDATDHAAKGKLKAGSMLRKWRAAVKAWSDYDVIKDWIYQQTCKALPDGEPADKEQLEAARQVDMEQRTQNFMISTAAYCVASYVLGLGDRHNDNLMITEEGNFFHIDFGHILGNFKSKMGVKRERAPFVFTHSMKAVMRDDQYDTFVDLCCDIYNILRDNSTLLVSLVSLAIPCNLPELQEEKNVSWIYEKLLVGASDAEAIAHFKSELNVALNTWGTRANDAAHMIAHS